MKDETKNTDVTATDGKPLVSRSLIVRNNAEFMKELANILSKDGKVNIDLYCSVLELVGKHFISDENCG